MFEISKIELINHFNLKSVFVCYEGKLYESFVESSEHFKMFKSDEFIQKSICVKIFTGVSYEDVLFNLTKNVKKGIRIFGKTINGEDNKIECYSSLLSLLSHAKVKNGETRTLIQSVEELNKIKDYNELLDSNHKIIPETVYFSSDNIKTKNELLHFEENIKMHSIKENKKDNLETNVNYFSREDIKFETKMIENKCILKIDIMYSSDQNRFNLKDLKIEKIGSIYNFLTTSNKKELFSSLSLMKSYKINELKKEIDKWENKNIVDKNSSKLRILF